MLRADLGVHCCQTETFRQSDMKMFGGAQLVAPGVRLCVVPTEIHSRPALAMRLVSKKVCSQRVQAGVSVFRVTPGKQKHSTTVCSK